MIELETLHELNRRDFAALTLLTTFSVIAQLSIKYLFDSDLNAIIFATIAFMTLILLVTRKFGIVALHNILLALIAQPLEFLGIKILTGTLILFVTGIIFELLTTFLKLKIKILPIDILLGDFASAALIPALIYATSSININGLKILLSSLQTGLVGIIAGILAFVLWYELQRTRTIMKYENQQ